MNGWWFIRSIGKCCIDSKLIGKRSEYTLHKILLFWMLALLTIIRLLLVVMKGAAVEPTDSTEAVGLVPCIHHHMFFDEFDQEFCLNHPPMDNNLSCLSVASRFGRELQLVLAWFRNPLDQSQCRWLNRTPDWYPVGIAFYSILLVLHCWADVRSKRSPDYCICYNQLKS